MKRYQKLLGPVLLALAAWGVTFRHCQGGGSCSAAAQAILPVLPLYALVVYGCYALAVIGMGVYSFNDVAQDAVLLDKDIQDAKRDLAKKGFKFDEPEAAEDSR